MKRILSILVIVSLFVAINISLRCGGNGNGGGLQDQLDDFGEILDDENGKDDITAHDPDCNDECVSGYKECSGNGYKECGDYDSDDCLEWSNLKSCGSGKICKDGQCIIDTDSTDSTESYGDSSGCLALGGVWAPDGLGGYGCFFQKADRITCTDYCADKGLVCRETNWNDSTDCEACLQLEFAGATNPSCAEGSCSASTESYAPYAHGYGNEHGGRVCDCFYRADTVQQSCSAKTHKISDNHWIGRTCLCDGVGEVEVNLDVPVVEEVEITKTIGTSGGKIEVTDESSPLYRVKVEVPQGALSEAVSIEIIDGRSSPPISSDITVVSPCIEILRSDGESLSFSEPVTVTLPYDETKTTDESQLLVIAYDKENDTLSPAALVGIDTSSNTVSAATIHCTKYWIIDMTIGAFINHAPTGFEFNSDDFPCENYANCPFTGRNHGAHCYGISAFTVWYFRMHRSEKSLYHAYDELSAKKIACDAMVAVHEPATKLVDDYIAFCLQSGTGRWDVMTGNSLIVSLKETGLPQVLLLSSGANDPEGHAVVVYGWDRPYFHVYDSNPPHDKTLKFDGLSIEKLAGMEDKDFFFHAGQISWIRDKKMKKIYDDYPISVECQYTCCSNSNCSGSAPYCEDASTSSSQCVECTSSSHCGSGETCSNNQCIGCQYTCCSNDDCSGTTPYCENAGTSSAECVACLSDSHCDDSETCSNGQCISESFSLTEVAYYKPMAGNAHNVYVSGNYAYVLWENSNLGLNAVDISDPSSPTFVSALFRPTDDCTEFFISGNYAYITCWVRGLWVVDISDLSSPNDVWSNVTGYPNDVYVSGKYAYVTYGYMKEIYNPDFPAAEGGLKIIDISDPTSPSEVVFYDALQYPFRIFVSGNYAYVADRKDLESFEEVGLRIIDISDPTSPSEVLFYDTPVQPYDVYFSGSYAYVAMGESGLRVIDISDPTSPNEVGSCDTPGRASRVYVSGNYAYVADGVGGLRVIDVSDLTSPKEVFSYDTGIDPNVGAKGIFVSGSHVYVTDSFKGLTILEID